MTAHIIELHSSEETQTTYSVTDYAILQRFKKEYGFISVDAMLKQGLKNIVNNPELEAQFDDFLRAKE